MANCINCHSGDGPACGGESSICRRSRSLKKGSQKRTDDQAIVIAGKPDESHLVLRIKGEEEPRMPQGGNNRMSDEAIATIAQWVKEGANLDAGHGPQEADQVVRGQPRAGGRRTRLPGCRLQSATSRRKGRAWNDGSRPIPSSSPRSSVASISSCSATCPATGAKATIKVMETQYGH